MNKKKKGWGSFISDLLYEKTDTEDEFDDDDDLDDESDAEINGLLPITPQDHIMPAVKEPKAPEIKLNANIVDAIKNVMDDNNLDGYDYYEFMQSISEQTDMPSEKRKFEVVYSVIKGMGITKQHLIDTATRYLNAIVKHQEEFNDTIASEESEKVDALKNRAESIESTITEKTELIEAIKKEIESLHNEKVEVLEIAQENEATIDKLRQEGDLAYKLFISQINDGKRKINEYISEGDANGNG